MESAAALVMLTVVAGFIFLQKFLALYPRKLCHINTSDTRVFTVGSIRVVFCIHA